MKSLGFVQPQDGSDQEIPVAGCLFYVGLRPNASSFEGTCQDGSAGFVITEKRNMVCNRSQGYLPPGI